jgi:hypothetical protein
MSVTAFTLGYAENYDQALTAATPDNPVVKVGRNSLRNTGYGGGWVWRTSHDAVAVLTSPTFAAAFPGRDHREFAVYALELPTSWEVDVSSEPAMDGVHRLLNDSPIRRV